MKTGRYSSVWIALLGIIAGALLVKDPFEFTYTLKSGEITRLSTDAVRIERRESKGTMYAMCVLDDIISSVE